MSKLNKPLIFIRTQLQWAREGRLNKEPVAKGFKEYIQPILQGKL